MSWLWDAFQQKQIGSVQQRASDAHFDAKAALEAIAELEEKVDRLSLVCHALFEELQRATGYSETQLKEKMLEIDLRDGKQDGKLDPLAGRKCPDCGHKITKKRPHCFWCGAKLSGLGM